jgi:hypothetical protein
MLLSVQIAGPLHDGSSDGDRATKHRRPLKITSRTSSITNSFVQAIIPSVPPTDEELNEGLAILGMTSDKLSCVYCGDPSTDWDHLRPLVRGRMPTGFIDDVHNRVPSCNRCNQSKSGADWRKWMEGNALGSPKRREVPDIKQRMQMLDAFEQWGAVTKLPLADLAGAASWEAHWNNRDHIVEKMREAQSHAEHVRDAIRDALIRK